MNLITDLHPCCKCHTWQDVDTMSVNPYIFGDWKNHLKKLICTDCEEKQREEMLSIFYFGIHCARGNDWTGFKSVLQNDQP